ncbi:MAG: LapA family protein [Phycisphaerales bacterium]|nr:LapA family protein [Phycisphaerales bacterium]
MGLFRWTRWAVGAVVIAMAGLFAVDQLRSPELRRLESEVKRLEKQKEQLLAYAQQLSASRRVAQVDVVRQTVDESGCRVSELVWREIAPDVSIGPTRSITTFGNLVYFEGAVIKFDFEAIGQDVPEQRTSLVLFRRVFGDCQMPVSVAELDRAAPLVTARAKRVEFPAPHASFAPDDAVGPDVSMRVDADPARRVENELWTLFWRLIDDPRLARTYDVRVAQIEAPAVPIREGDVWEITLDAAGGLNLRKLGTRATTGDASPDRDRVDDAPGNAGGSGVHRGR